MIEPKISLSLLIPGASMLSSQECDKNPKENYDENKLVFTYTKGKGKNLKKIKKVVAFQTRKQRMVTQSINMCKETYEYMLETPTSPKFNKPVKRNKAGIVTKRVWDTMSIDERLKEHFDQIAYDLHAVSYSYEILGD